MFRYRWLLVWMALSVASSPLWGGGVRRGRIVGSDGVTRDGTIITVTSFQLPDPTRVDAHSRAQVAVMNEFLRRFPELFERKYRRRYESDPSRYGRHDWSNVRCELVRGSGIVAPGEGFDSGPLMAIAGGVSPDIIYVNFRQSDTYIREGFLYPLDKPEDGYFTGLDDEERSFIYNEKVMPVVRRRGADGQEHVWAIPNGGLLGKVFLYRKDLLARNGLPEPDSDWTWEDLLRYCRRLTNPKEGIYGIALGKGLSESWFWVTFLWSAGGEVMAYDDATDSWRACFDTDEAVTALDFYLRLTAEHWRDEDGRDRHGYAMKEAGTGKKWDDGQIAFYPAYIDERLFQTINPDLVGMVPVPRGYPDARGVRHRGGELNSRMQGIFSGCTNPVVRDAAWEYLRFCESPDGVAIYTRVMVEGGLGQYLNPAYLERFGYGDLVRLAPPGWRETFEVAIETGRPEPYGRNCQLVYHQMTKPMNVADEMAVRGELPLSDAAERDEAEARLARGERVPALELRRKALQAALAHGVRETNERMIGILPPETLRLRRLAAAGVLGAIVVAFALVFRKIARVFTPERIEGMEEVRWGFRRYRAAYLLLLPALLSILVWKYVPLAIGSAMALQDYRLVGESSWVWLDNFANLLWDGEWWASVWNSIRYCFLVVALTFLPPVILAVLLQEIPVGRMFFRTVFYLPAVITGLVVIYLWRSFYSNDESGVLNAIMLRLPSLAYVALALLALSIMLFFAKRLLLHGNILAGLACLATGVALGLFFLRFAWPILTDADRDPLPEALARWRLAWCVLAGASALALAWRTSRAWTRRRRVLAVVLGLAALALAAGAVAPSLSEPCARVLARLFLPMRNPYLWLDDTETAMLCCVLPMVWAGMGPGCLIYLAALKGIADDFYEAADIDGATFIDKLLFVVIPMLKPLLIIQFVGVFIGSWASSSFILAMTGGAKATEVADLHIFYRAYLYLKFGSATAMAWMLGFLLIGFTVYQLQILSRLEFKANTAKRGA